MIVSYFHENFRKYLKTHLNYYKKYGENFVVYIEIYMHVTKVGKVKFDNNSNKSNKISKIFDTS